MYAPSFENAVSAIEICEPLAPEIGTPLKYHWYVGEGYASIEAEIKVESPTIVAASTGWARKNGAL